MKSLRLAAALAAALFAAPLLAAPAHAADPPKAPTKQQLEKGAKDGPALVAASGIACTPDQITWQGSGKDPKTKAEINGYEVSCKEGLGYVILANAAEPKPQAYDCLTAADSPQKCILPGNADPKKGLAQRVAAAGRPCDVKDARYVGTSVSTGTAFYELACNQGPGFRVAMTGAKIETTDCLLLIDSPNECKLTSRAEATASLAPAVQASGKACPLKDARYVGAASSGEAYYEVACQTGPGFMVVVDEKLAFKRAVDCSKAQGLNGGCKMTDVTVSETADAATYTKLATKAGFPCQVTKYRFIGMDKQNREAVELACSNRPDGALALLTDTGKSDVYDCVRAGALGQECKLSSPEAVYPKYTQALAAKGKTTCKVSGARFIGSTDKADYVEAACSDGLPGWVLVLAPGTDSAQDLLTCKQAAATGVACKLPTNTAGG
jgi:hypothetical protein